MASSTEPLDLRIAWEKNMLTISGEGLPGETMKVWYLEAYCRAGSTDREWKETVIPHETKLIKASSEGQEIRLRCTVSDGVVVDHVITAKPGEIGFAITAHNPTEKVSEVHWAQPCIRVGGFTGTAEVEDKYAYLPKSFVFLEGKLQRLPTPGWATKARYIPGQVWCPKGVPPSDVNPRPLSDEVPSNGLIGCFSGDGKWIMATAFEPYQELFQGVIRCLHSDFRIGGLEAGGTKRVRGKIYLVPADVEALLERYREDFPEHGK